MTVTPPSAQEMSFRRRYAAKLGASIIGLAVSFVNISVLPRALSPRAYGSFDFLTSFFQSVSGFWDFGSSSAFFTRVSRRPEDAGVIRFYAAYTVLVLGTIAAGVGVVAWLGFGKDVWPDQEWRYILLAAVLGYFVWMSDVLRKLVDALGLTVRGELTVLMLRGIGAAAVVTLFLAGWLNLTTLFLKEQALGASVVIGLGLLAARHWRRHLHAQRVSTPPARVAREFWAYCSPLIVYSLAGVAASFADRWILQKFAGSEHQGFYALASRVASVSLIFSAAMVQLLQREFSRAHAGEDFPKMRYLFSRYIPPLFAVTTYFAAFISAETTPLVSLMGGAAYGPAVPATMIMALFPIHQMCGQVSGSMFYATNQTGLYRNLGVASMIVGLAVTWFTVAPHAYGGLAGGSAGLAVKMLVLQAVWVNIQLWFNLKHVGLRLWPFLRHQLLVVGVFLGLAWAARLAVELTNWHAVPAFLAGGVIYSAAVAGVLLRWPSMAGMSHEDLKRLIRRLEAWRK